MKTSLIHGYNLIQDDIEEFLYKYLIAPVSPESTIASYLQPIPEEVFTFNLKIDEVKELSSASIAELCIVSREFHTSLFPDKNYENLKIYISPNMKILCELLLDNRVVIISAIKNDGDSDEKDRRN